MDNISTFRGEYHFLSNFYQHPFPYKGLVYPNAEAAFQAQKCSSDADRIKYTLQKNPVRAKQMVKKEPNLPQIGMKYPMISCLIFFVQSLLYRNWLKC